MARYRFPGGHNMEAVQQWSFEARVKGGHQLHCASDSHSDMNIRADGGDLLATASATNAALKRDVTLEIRDQSAEAR